MLLCWILGASALTLEDAWSAADKDGHESHLLQEQRFQTDLLRGQAWAAMSPKISLNGNWTLNQRETVLSFSFPPDVTDLIEKFTGKPLDMGEPTVINRKQYFDWNLTIAQPIFSGKAFPGLRGAQALADAGEAQEQAGRAQVHLGIARAYWAVVVAREAEKLSAAALELANANVKTAAAQLDAGNVTRQVLLQAQIAQARGERDLVGAAARRLQAEQTFANLTGMDEKTPLQMPEPHAPEYASVEEAVERAKQRRPDLRAASSQARAAQMASLASTLSWLPDLNARFTEAYTENTGFSGENYTWIFVATASWTLWDGGFRMIDNQRSASQLRQARENLEKAEEDAETTVRNAWEEQRRAKLAMAAVQRENDLAAENLRLAELSFVAGTATFLDQETARLGYDSARIALLTETMNLDLAALSLLAATGDLP